MQHFRGYLDEVLINQNRRYASGSHNSLLDPNHCLTRGAYSKLPMLFGIALVDSTTYVKMNFLRVRKDQTELILYNKMDFVPGEAANKILDDINQIFNFL